LSGRSFDYPTDGRSAFLRRLALEPVRAFPRLLRSFSSDYRTAFEKGRRPHVPAPLVPLLIIFHSTASDLSDTHFNIYQCDFAYLHVLLGILIPREATTIVSASCLHHPLFDNGGVSLGFPLFFRVSGILPRNGTAMQNALTASFHVHNVFTQSRRALQTAVKYIYRTILLRTALL